jgi:predicted transglutaminase-like cysteine proteinase
MCSKKVIFCLILSIATLYIDVANAGLFGSMERKNRDLGEFPKWTGMLQRLQIDENTCDSRQNCRNSKWNNFIQSQKGNPDKIATLRAVNRFINDVKYVDDRASWKESDYWETPYQFFSKGGDCEDYAIAKFVTLLKIGFDNDDMRVVVLNNTHVNTIHAVLVVYVNGKAYLLDNQIPIVTEAKEINYYHPIYSINETNWWKHS